MVRIKELIDQLPKRYNASKEIANRLNQKKIKTPYGKEYNYHGVKSVLDEKYSDSDVFDELVEIVEEKKIDEAVRLRKAKIALAN
jgi:hypothetical protein